MIAIIRKARTTHQCGSCDRPILPGERYRSSVVPPQFDGLGNVGWWRMARCVDCGRRYGDAWVGGAA